MVIPRHVPGDRDFYEEPGENSKFYRRAEEKGLSIQKAYLGPGTVTVLDLRQACEIGEKLLAEDPLVTLPD